MKKMVLISSLLFSFGYTISQTRDELAIRNILAEQVKYWNEGNLTGFMNGYWKSDSLMFIGKKGVTYGWQQTMDNYKAGYPDTAAMGKLNFELVNVKRLSVMYFFVVGKWHLTRQIGDIGGSFTLLFRKIKNTWVIITDHSS